MAWFSKPPIVYQRPPWLTATIDDPLNNLFGNFKLLWKEGIVVWAWVVMANQALYEEGADDFPGEVLYSFKDADEEALHELPGLGERLWNLKIANSPDPGWSEREAEIAADLADEMVFHAGFRLPENWLPHERDYRLSTIIFHREHLPGGRLQTRLLPLLIFPFQPFHAVVVPFQFWPDEVIELVNDYKTVVRAVSPALDPREQRETAYEDVFGPISSVLHELLPGPDHLDVYIFAPREGREHWTFATGGMSDRDQPDGDESCPSRTELVFYSSKKQPSLLEALRIQARYPWETGQPLGHGHTLPLGDNAELILGSDRFSVLLLIAALQKNDSRLGGMIQVDGAPVYPLMVVPLTESEFTFYQTNGMEAFIKKVSESTVSIIFDPDRESVV